MCCLFGLIDYRKNLSLKKRQRILRVLAIECEERGTDATGIAFFINHHLWNCQEKCSLKTHKF